MGNLLITLNLVYVNNSRLKVDCQHYQLPLGDQLAKEEQVSETSQ